MNKDQISRKVKEIIAYHIPCDIGLVKNDSLLIDDLDADSLDAIEIVMAIERELSIEIPDADIGDLSDYEFIRGYCVQNLIDAAAKQFKDAT